MSKTKVKRDQHSLYIRTDGRVFRPVYPVGYAHAHKTPTRFQENDAVTASHCSGGPLASVRGALGREHWFNHGAYFAPGHFVATDKLWQPAAYNWPSP
jgi:hypothetical protein